MGVKHCDRAGCDEIMCSWTVLGDKYYICYDCLEELRSAWKRAPSVLTTKAVEAWVAEFMNTEKRTEEQSLTQDVIDIFERLLDARDK